MKTETKTEETQGGVDVEITVKTPSFEEMLQSKVQQKEAVMQYPPGWGPVDGAGKPISCRFGLRQIIDDREINQIIEKAGQLASEHRQFKHPITGDKFRVDFNQAFRYARLAASLFDPNEAGKPLYTAEQIVVLSRKFGNLIADLAARCSALNDIYGVTEDLKNS
jgi:hypothetical protein